MNLKSNSRHPQIVVSLTSFPAAIPYAIHAIQSILDGTTLPDKIVLYLTFSQFVETGIPQNLLDLAKENSLFEIRDYPVDIRSYRKLIPALKDYPEDIIVTIDDDVFYDKNMLRDLLRVHKKYPKVVVAHRVRRIVLNAPYRKWRKYKYYDFFFRKYIHSYRSMQTGVGGVLYPPHSLDEKMLNPELFMEMAPTNDDVWFWAAAVSLDNVVMPVPGWHSKLKEIGKPEEYTLRNINLNSEEDLNRRALDKILFSYPFIRVRVEKGNS